MTYWFSSEGMIIMNKEYIENLKELKNRTVNVLKELGISEKYCSFDETGNKEDITIPTGANSEFLSNRAMGDWAEKKVSELFSKSTSFKVVHYGDSDSVSAEDENFRSVYLNKIEDTRLYGKRPDLLLMGRDYTGENDVSLKSTIENDDIARNALYAIEVRSSKFEAKTYEEEKFKRIKNDNDKKIEEAMIYCISSNEDKQNYDEYIRERDSLDSEEEALLRIQYTQDKAEQKISELRVKRKKLKIKNLSTEDRQKRLDKIRSKYDQNKLSSEVLKFTVKVEDLRIVYRWMMRYKIPQIYVQVFFDSMYAINVLKIFELVARGKDNWPKFMKIDTPAKSQNKTTIVIPITEGMKVADSLSMPIFRAEEKKTRLGRHDAYVIPEEGKYNLIESNLNKILNYNLNGAE